MNLYLQYFLIVSIILSTNISSQELSFSAGDEYTITSELAGICSGDLNEDSINDLVFASYAGYCVTVLINKGDGTFYPHVNYSTGGHASDVIIVNVGGDSLPDIVATSWNMDWIAVFINKGDGTFFDAVTYGVALGPEAITTADYNKDGYNDIITVNSYLGNSFSIFVNEGNGYFINTLNFPLGSFPHSIITSDFNNDDFFDLAITTNNSIYVYHNSGDTDFVFFQFSQNFPYPGYNTDLFSADINGDNFNDLFFTNYDSNQVIVLLSSSDGIFDSLFYYSVGENPIAINAVDFDMDGHNDLATLNQSSNDISILFNNGVGDFSLPLNIPSFNYQLLFVCSDLDGDNDIDMAVGHTSNRVTILLNETYTDMTPDEATGTLPKTYYLNQNYPNPFNPTTTISFRLPNRALVKLSIYDILGREIRTLINESRSAGFYNINWNGVGNSGYPVASGIYFYQIQIDDFKESKKMILIK